MTIIDLKRIKMSSINYFELLVYDTDSEDDSELEVKVEVEDNKVNSEFMDSESTSNKKSFLKKRTRQFKYPKNKYQKVQVYDEMGNLPSSLDDAIRTRQDLTLKQILVLMNLHAIPGMAVNIIHDKIQQRVRKMLIKISHNGRVFYVSQYHWYDLKKIEKLIDDMFNTY